MIDDIERKEVKKFGDYVTTFEDGKFVLQKVSQEGNEKIYVFDNTTKNPSVEGLIKKVANSKDIVRMMEKVSDAFWLDKQVIDEFWLKYQNKNNIIYRHCPVKNRTQLIVFFGYEKNAIENYLYGIEKGTKKSKKSVCGEKTK